MGPFADIAALPPFPFWAIAGLAVGLALLGLYTGYRGLHRARMIENVPTARVRSAHQGYIELIGTAQVLEGEPIVAPLSGMQCCWYRFRVEERGDNRWRSVQRGRSDGLFLLRDETGECLVDPEGADITPMHVATWYGDGGSGGAPGVHYRDARPRGLALRFAEFGLRVGVSALAAASRYRFTEEVIMPDDPLYAIGHFKSYDDIDHGRNRAELTAEILRDWKRRPETLRERFDHDRDGQIDAEEWEEARRVAAEHAAQEYADQMRNQQLHSLRRPPNRRLPFLISNLPEFGLVRRYRWRAGGGLLLFFLTGAAATLLLTARLSGN